jgi:ribosomal protein L11 methyltransferase
MREIGSGLWQATVETGNGPIAPFADLLEGESAGISMFEGPDGDWSLTALYRSPPDRGALQARLALTAAAHGLAEPSLDIAALPPSDWLAMAYAGFPARRIGRFYVHGSHVPPPSGGAIALHIDAATAFGSGEHATTEGCLLAISGLAKLGFAPRRALDMGTGSGILAIAIAKYWRNADVAAVDIDPESARVATLNAKLNGVAANIDAVQGNGYRSPLAMQGGKFDLIVSNILARPLIRMAPSLARRLAPGGIAILSGLLQRQERAVLAAHLAVGLRLVGRQPIGDWQTLILRA